MALNRAQIALNLMRTMGSKVYKDTVPALTESTPIETIWNVFTSQPLVYKEFTQLFGAFLELEVQKDTWNNVLNELIISGTPLGEFSAVVGSNPAQPHKYDASQPQKFIEYAMSDDKVVYYARNIKEFFKVSFAYEDMKGAFRSYEKFDEYLSMKLATLESGKQISSYNHIMESLVINYYSGVFTESNVHISKETTNYGAWLTELKNAYDEMQFPNTKFNNYGKLEGANGDFKGWSRAEDLYIIARIDWINKIDVEYLASVFNLDKAEIGKRIRKIPEFSYNAYDDEGNFLSKIESPIQAIIIDRRAFKYKNDLDLDTSWFNEETLVSNYWKHFWATYQINPLAQALVFTAPEGAETDQNTNFYDVLLNQPSTTTVKNNTNNTLSVNAVLGMSDTGLRGVNGNLVDFDFENPSVVETTDYEFTAEEYNEAVGNLFFYMLIHGLTVDSSEIEATALIEYMSNPSELISDLTANASGTITLARIIGSAFKSGKYVLAEAVPETSDEISFIITDEVMDVIKANFGNNILCDFIISGDDDYIEPVTITVDLANNM